MKQEDRGNPREYVGIGEQPKPPVLPACCLENVLEAAHKREKKASNLVMRVSEVRR